MFLDDTWVPASKLHTPQPKQPQPKQPQPRQQEQQPAQRVAATTEVASPAASAAEESEGVRPSTRAEPILKISGLTVKFARSGTIFEDLDLTIRQGERVCIVGSNGAGKSTLVKACLGIVPAQEGTVELFGEKYDARQGPSKDQLARIGMVHQRHNLIAQATALANTLHGAISFHPFKPSLWYQCFAPQELRERALYYLERVGIGEKAGNLAKELSGGQSQRVAIARALMQGPPLIIADEPVASLDPVSALHVMGVFARLVAEEGKTLLFISHHLSHAVEFADRIVGIKNNRIGFDVAAKETSFEELESIYGE